MLGQVSLLLPLFGCYRMTCASFEQCGDGAWYPDEGVDDGELAGMLFESIVVICAR